MGVALPHCKGEYQLRDSLMVTCIAGVGNTGATKSAKLLLAAFPKSCTSFSVRSNPPDYSADTWWCISNHQRWSCDAAFLGVEPSAWSDGMAFDLGSDRAARAGRALAGGKRFVCWGIVGDIDMFCNHLYLPHWSTDNMCLGGLCLAQKKAGPFVYNDFREDHSYWLKNPLSPQHVRENHPSEHRHPWFSIPGMSTLMVHFGVMHCFDQNGCLAHALAGVLFEIVFLQIGGNRASALAFVWKRIVALYAKVGATYRLSKLTLDMFCTSKAPFQNYPCLSTAIKAAETRQLLPVVLELSREFDTGTKHHENRRVMLGHLAAFYDAMKSAPTIPSREDGRVIFQSCRDFLLVYQACSHWALSEGHLLYNTPGKFHHTFHLGQQGRYLNPRATWEYAYEDFVGKMITLGHACAFGSVTFKLSLRIARKHVIAFHLQLMRHWDD